jgi:outer membrane protein
MKKTAIILFLFSATFALQAQKFAYVDSKYILEHIPEYASAQSELNRVSTQWQEEIEQKYENIDRLVQSYEAEKVLLPEDMRKRRQEEIEQKRQEAREMQKQKFGVDGELFAKREQLIKPIQEDIYEAIKDVSTDKGYMVVFDKSSQSNMLYTNPKHDVSDQIIRKLGLNPGETLEQPGGKGDEGEKEGGKEGGGEKPGGAGKPGGGGTGPGGTNVPRTGKKQ